MTVGITGGIGAGKSVVSRVLRCNGMIVYDCDYEAKKLMVENSEVKKKLIESFGETIYFKTGELNRKLLASIIFSDEEKRNIINKIVHEAVRNNILYVRVKTKNRFFIESAILATGGLEEMCNDIWVVESPIETRVRRVMKRDGVMKMDVIRRMDSQQQELSKLPSEKITVLENDNEHPILKKILKLIYKYNLQNTYTLC